MQEQLTQKLQKIVKELTVEDIKIEVNRTNDSSHGDFATSVALVLAKTLGRNPRELAEEIADRVRSDGLEGIEKIEVAGPGFINFYLSSDYLKHFLEDIQQHPEKIGVTDLFKGQRMMVEYAHPNTHKEAHIGHTRTLMTGESIARILGTNGATVFRANYQGDVGPHVAKAVYGVNKALKNGEVTLSELESWDTVKKVHFLGQSYATGNTDYQEHKEEIDGINKLIYKHGEGNTELWDLYQLTRGWSLAYYEDLYKRFDVKFDRLFFETEMAEDGPRIVREHIEDVFVQNEDGSVIFPGEEYGLHTRVFITQAGTPTYEGKEMANAMLEAKEFPFDKKIHVVGSEQEGYFKVVFKALELIDPEKFVGKQVHLPTGIIQLKGRKMSSRTGDVLTYDQLIDEVKSHVKELFVNRDLTSEEKEVTTEVVALGAIKYSVLNGGTRQNVVFDMEKSISLQGDSGPYIQYTYVRTQSILRKVGVEEKCTFDKEYSPHSDELGLLRQLVTFAEVVQDAGEQLAPNKISTYLYELAKNFNAFYQKYRIADASSEAEKQFRLALTQATGNVLKKGLNLLGIVAPEKM